MCLRSTQQTFDSKLSPYVGTGEPRWSWINVEVEGKTVAVVIVEAPQWGDPSGPLAAIRIPGRVA